MDNFILPDTSMVMAVRYKGHVSFNEVNSGSELPALVLSGIRQSAQLVHYAQQTANLLIMFKPGGAAAFFREPLHYLSDQSLPTDCLDSYSASTNLPERLILAKTNAERVSLIEQFLQSKLIKPQPDLLITSAIQSILLAGGAQPIHLLSKQLNISQDAFEKRFRRVVGTSPKHFSTIVRLRTAIRSHSPANTLTDTALTAGYYDQAHFSKDFRLFTGQAPKDFFRSARYW